jgi:hypothetical protein
MVTKGTDEAPELAVRWRDETRQGGMWRGGSAEIGIVVGLPMLVA